MKDILKDTSNVYYCISFKAESDGNRFDENNEIFWSYFARAPEKNKLTIVTDNGFIMMGVRLGTGVTLRREPNFIHAKWNISHSDPFFDRTQRDNIIRPSQNPGCGKADIMMQKWTDQLDFQMKTSLSETSEPNVHFVLTICNDSQDIHFEIMGSPIVDSRLFLHVHWDKDASKGHSWKPFKFSQCCTTMSIAPTI